MHKKSLLKRVAEPIDDETLAKRLCAAFPCLDEDAIKQALQNGKEQMEEFLLQLQQETEHA